MPHSAIGRDATKMLAMSFAINRLAMILASRIIAHDCRRYGWVAIGLLRRCRWTAANRAES
jgi:hypothetical protein